MSDAGVRSSQGDSFQSWVATRYVMEMLYTPELREIEVDSTSFDSTGNAIVVDDVVVRYDNRTLFIQAKKNQTNFRAWSIADLGDELTKAWVQWRREPSADLLFVSRNDFGDVAKLADYATIKPTVEAFDRSLTRKQRQIADQVTAYDEQGGDRSDLFAFLQRISFETVSPQRIQSDISGLLTLHVAHGPRALVLIKQRVDDISRREPASGGVKLSRHSITRQDLFEILRAGGVEVCRPKAEQEALNSLAQLSRVGRSWQRKIGNAQLERPAIEEMLVKVAEKPHCLLLSAGPGIGKTCLLLSVLERLEHDPAVLPVFIQAREFSGARTADEREAIGLPSSFVGDVARMSEVHHVVVLIDSIDVLSIARDHNSMAHILSLIDRLRLIPNVTVVAACRSFDLKYDARLADRDWGEIIQIDLLDWHTVVEPMLSAINLAPCDIPSSLQDLLCNPRLLAIFHDIVSRGEIPNATSAQELTEHYLQRVVREADSLGDAAMSSIMAVARWMLDNRRLDIPLANARMSQDMIRSLLSAGVLIETSQRCLSFAHQTLLDVLAVAHSKAEEETLAAFIRKRAAAPFIRPTVRAFLFSLRMDNIAGFRRQVREVIDSDDIAFHLRRLVAESLAEIHPTSEDWPLIRHVFGNQRTLFESFYLKATTNEWLSFFELDWLNLLVRDQEGYWLIRLLERMAGSKRSTSVFLDLWKQALGQDWVDQRNLRWVSSHLLERFTDWGAIGLRDIFERLVADNDGDHGALGKPLSKWVEANDSHDDLLWRYITRRIDESVLSEIDFGKLLECDTHSFCRERFLHERMQLSETLLNMAVDSVESWSAIHRRSYEADMPWSEGFLHYTRFERVHTASGMRYMDALTVLMSAIEGACMFHAERQSGWWVRNACRLRNSRDGALRYFAVQAMTDYPEANVLAAAATLLDRAMLNSHRFRWEIGLLISAVYPHLSSQQQDRIELLLFEVDDEHRDEFGNLPRWGLLAKRSLLIRIPTNYRTKKTQALVDLVEEREGPFSLYPEITGWGGWVRPPVPRDIILGLSNEALLRLLNHYPTDNPRSRDWDHSGLENLVGGADQVATELREAASIHPKRFLDFLRMSRRNLDVEYREAIVAGIAYHLRYRFGNLRSSDGWSPVEEPNGTVVAGWLLQELESHYDFWLGRREKADALYAIASVIDSEEDADRAAFLLMGCLASKDPSSDRQDTSDLMFVAINSTRGIAAEGAFTLAQRWSEAGRRLPRLLIEVLKRCASDPHSSVRALVLRSLPALLYFHQKLGWSLFETALLSNGDRPWKYSYNCLYYNYYREFPTVRNYLAMLRADGDQEALDVWGRISTLCCLGGHISMEVLLGDLAVIDQGAAWSGAASIFAANLGEVKLREQCNRGLLAALSSEQSKSEMLSDFSTLFHENKCMLIDLEFLRSYFDAFETKGIQTGRRLLGVGDWLASVGVSDPEYALQAAEIFLGHTAQLDAWDGTPYTKLLTALFREAEERELSDGGDFLSRVVRVQDTLLRLGVHKLEDWLQDAERP